MTAKEFNEKYKDYIEEGFEDQGLSFDEPVVTDYLDKLFTDLIKIPGFQYSQIKLKFGMCRFYTNLRTIVPTLDEFLFVERDVNRFISTIEKYNKLNGK